jgi:PPM family protein phosphatase
MESGSDPIRSSGNRRGGVPVPRGEDVSRRTGSRGRRPSGRLCSSGAPTGAAFPGEHPSNTAALRACPRHPVLSGGYPERVFPTHHRPSEPSRRRHPPKWARPADVGAGIGPLQRTLPAQSRLAPREAGMTRSSGKLVARVWGLSDVGRVRAENQDCFEVVDLGREEGNGRLLAGPPANSEPHAQASPLGSGGRRARGGSDGDVPREVEVPVADGGLLLVVADGMGGAAGGGLAARMAAGAISDTLRKRWATEPHPSPERFLLHLREAVEEANRRVFVESRRRRDLRGMGTTATVAGCLGRAIHVAQVGDSRAYLIRNGTTTQLTRDQSMVQQLVDRGAMTRDEAERSIHRSVLLQAVGTEESIEAAFTSLPIEPGDHILLCSDGLSGLVTDREFGTVVVSSSSLPEACSRLVEMANARGGVDNITAVLLRVDADDTLEAEDDA